MADCIIMFAKNPAPKQVKSRLIPHLSPAQAASLYKSFLRDWCGALSKITTAHFVIAYTPPDSLKALQSVLGRGAIYIPQVGAHLGERLVSAARWACDQNYAKFLFVGSDSPTLPHAYVQRAFDLLENRDMVIGPSMDGGYYLIGFSARGAALAIPTVFRDITWSTDVVLQQTLEKVQLVGARLGLLPPWYDIDTPADLKFLRDHLFAMHLAGEEIPAPQTDAELSKMGESANVRVGE